MPNRLSKIDTQQSKGLHVPPHHLNQPVSSIQTSAHGDFQLPMGLPPPPLVTADGTSSPNLSPYTPRPPSRGRPQTPPNAGRISPALTPPESGSPNSGKGRRRSWLPGSRKSSRSDEPSHQPKSIAWIAGQHGHPPYDINPLVRGMKVPELWDETGDTFVYLFPKSSKQGPSFRIHSAIYSSSMNLTKLAFGALYSGKSKKSSGVHRKPIASATGPSSDSFRHLDFDNAPSFGGSSSSDSSRRSQTEDTVEQHSGTLELHLQLSFSFDPAVAAKSPDVNIPPQDLDTLLTTRNMFAFLMGQSLIGMEKRASIFSIFMGVCEALKCYGFTNLDGSTYGEIASSSFDNYVEELNLNDVRVSREKTLEALILGERMKSVTLYNEAFTHAVGRYSDLQDVKRFPTAAAKFKLVSPVTLNRMERAAIDLTKREEKVKLRLCDFDIPSLWAGIVTSKVADEGKVLRFQAWKENFAWMRKHVIAYYKDSFGAWPPKATAKNDIEISGLNRLVLRTLYRDFSALYDLFVDRTSLTTRSSDEPPPSVPREASVEESAASALRKILDEFDHSIPPVQPPIPYDLPKLPNVASIGKDPRDFNARNKKLSQEDVARVLNTACNHDTLHAAAKSPFVTSTLLWESKVAKGSSVAELLDLRAGIWIFTYVVLNSLPMLVVDAPGVAHTSGVEYFLCEPPRSGVPWANAQAGEAARSKNTWYGIAGGAGVVNLPSDLVEHGVEGVYRRSHCWQMAKLWGPDPTATGQQTSPPDPGHFNSARTSTSQDSNSSHRGRPLNPPIIKEPTQIFDPEYTIKHSPYDAPQLAPPPPQLPRSRSPSPAHGRHESVVALGLEALPLPAGVRPSMVQDHRRSASLQTPAQPGQGTHKLAPKGSATFDDIFKSMEKGKAKKGKK